MDTRFAGRVVRSRAEGPQIELQRATLLHDRCSTMDSKTRIRSGTWAESRASSRARRGFLGLVALAAAACSPPPMDVPRELLGTWVTTDPRYQDRTLVLRPDAIVFGTGPLTTDRHSLIGVEPLEPDEGWTSYRLSFRETDAEVSTLELAYRVAATPELRLRNRDEIWRPEGSIPDPTKAIETPEKKSWTDDWMVREKGDG